MSDDPLPLQGEPRSQVWRWLLGSSSTLAAGLIVSLMTGLVLATFGNSGLSAVLTSAFQWPFWIVLLSSFGLVVYRIGSGIRNRRRFDRELELTEGLIAPARPVIGPKPRSVEPSGASGGLPVRAGWLLYGIDQVKVTSGYGVDALLAVYTAMVSAPHRIPEDRPETRESVLLLLRELVAHGYVKLTEVGRVVRTPRPLPASDASASGYGLKPDSEAWKAGLSVAVPALLQHHADLATRWAAALNTTRLVGGAVQWFTQSHEQLRELVRAVDDSRTAVVVELCRIADALEIWYARTGQPAATKALASHIVRLAKSDLSGSAPVLDSLAGIRTGAAGHLPAVKPRKFRIALEARAEHHDGLAKLNQALAGQPDEAALLELEDQLEKVWWKLTPDDVVGEVCALVNLAIIHLRQGRLEAAQDRLELADSLTRTGGDPSGRAHALEISGLVCWAQGTPRRAVAHWQRALSLYRDLEEDHGLARCLRHLAMAVIADPDLSGRLLAADPPANSTLAVLHAMGWLRQAEQLDGKKELTLSYRRKARERYAALSRSRLPAIRGWPDGLDPYPTQSEPWRGWLRPFRR